MREEHWHGRRGRQRGGCQCICLRAVRQRSLLRVLSRLPNQQLRQFVALSYPVVLTKVCVYQPRSRRLKLWVRLQLKSLKGVNAVRFLDHTLAFWQDPQHLREA